MATGMKGKRRINTISSGLGLDKDSEEMVRKKELLEPIKVLNKDGRRIGIFTKENTGNDAYFLLEFGKKDVPGCQTIEYSSLRLAEKEARTVLKEQDEIPTGGDAGLCSSCNNDEFSFMKNCEDFKTNRRVKTITKGKKVT